MTKTLKYLTAGGMCLVLVTLGCVVVRPGKKKQGPIEGQAGRNLSFYSISIDANYDSRLNELIPGYKLLPIVMRNSSLRAVPMDAGNDRWIIVGERGQRYTAINSLRIRNPKMWRGIPDKMRTMIDYPEIVPINYSVTFDLLLPEKVRLEYFKEIRYYNAAWKQWFVVEKRY